MGVEKFKMMDDKNETLSLSADETGKTDNSSQNNELLNLIKQLSSEVKELKKERSATIDTKNKPYHFDVQQIRKRTLESTT